MTSTVSTESVMQEDRLSGGFDPPDSIAKRPD
jgi:hypothetical protein